jgi:GTP-binding protein HflX
LLLHVVDAASPEHAEQMAEVQKVLADIGADQVPQVLVFNKLDAMPESRLPHALQDSCELMDEAQGSPRRFERVFLSARTGEGLPALRALLSHHAQAAALQAQTGKPQGQSPADDEAGF